MFKKNFFGIVLLMLFSLGLGCSGALPSPTELHLRGLKKFHFSKKLSEEKGRVKLMSKIKNLGLKDLKRGRAIYIEKCSSCHHLYRPKEYSLTRWFEAVREMEEEQEVEITDQEKSLLLGYIFSVKLALREKKRDD